MKNLIQLSAFKTAMAKIPQHFLQRSNAMWCYKFLFLAFVLMTGANRLAGQNCSGTPDPGATTTTVPSPVAEGQSFTLGISKAQTSAGISYQWESSTDGNNFTGIAGATQATYTVSGISGQTWYRCKVTCSFGSSVNSSTIQMKIKCSGTPVAGNTICPSTTINDPITFGDYFYLNINVTHQWHGITYQWQVSTDSITWTDITGATNKNQQIKTMTATSWYRCKVSCTHSGQFAFSTPGKVFYSPYCAIKRYGNDPCWEGPTKGGIKLVQVGSFTNTSASDQKIYESFMHKTILLTLGSISNVSMSGDFVNPAFSEGVSLIGIWIDYNQDGDFNDQYETAWSGKSGIGKNGITASILIPTNARQGVTRMRVGSIYEEKQSTINPCVRVCHFGQFEDYSVRLDPRYQE